LRDRRLKGTRWISANRPGDLLKIIQPRFIGQAQKLSGALRRRLKRTVWHICLA
jgi:hypothetical protein